MSVPDATEECQLIWLKLQAVESCHVDAGNLSVPL